MGTACPAHLPLLLLLPLCEVQDRLLFTELACGPFAPPPLGSPGAALAQAPCGEVRPKGKPTRVSTPDSFLLARPLKGSWGCPLLPHSCSQLLCHRGCCFAPTGVGSTSGTLWSHLWGNRGPCSVQEPAGVAAPTPPACAQRKSTIPGQWEWITQGLPEPVDFLQWQPGIMDTVVNTTEEWEGLCGEELDPRRVHEHREGQRGRARQEHKRSPTGFGPRPSVSFLTCASHGGCLGLGRPDAPARSTQSDT